MKRIFYGSNDLILHHPWHPSTHWVPPPLSSLMSIKAHSVVKIIPATEAAFSRATRVTFRINNTRLACQHTHQF
jgi:hypothetical protein